jgi:pimeloyl-ACP methyl ester carboxylesterase
MRRLPLVLAGLAISLFGCGTAPSQSGQGADQGRSYEGIISDEMIVKDAIDVLVATALEAGDGSLVSTILGTGDTALTVYAAAPRAPRGTALFVHGYMASVASSGPAIKTLLNDGWLVVALDLPGHGKSGGTRLDIGDFSEYGAALRLVADALAVEPGPLVLVGHSLGAATILSSLEGMTAKPDAVVLIAPLLRIRAHGLASFGAALAKPFTKTLPGGTPVRWFNAYKAWARGDPAPALNAALARGTRVGFVLCGGDEAVSNTAAMKLVKRSPGSKLTALSGMSHWEIDKEEPDPRLWEAVLSFLSDLAKEAP